MNLDSAEGMATKSAKITKQGIGSQITTKLFEFSQEVAETAEK
jgi:hypothetical protein